jgi:hypothetical protein
MIPDGDAEGQRNDIEPKRNLVTVRHVRRRSAEVVRYFAIQDGFRFGQNEIALGADLAR